MIFGLGMSRVFHMAVIRGQLEKIAQDIIVDIQLQDYAPIQAINALIP